MKDERIAKRKIIEQNSLEFKTKNLSESEIYSFEKLYSYLNLKLKKPINYEDLNNLCYSLFCTIDILPENLQFLKITKKVLALIRTEILTENFNEFIELDDSINEEYWIEQIRKSMINDIWPNIENAKILLESN
ncbi:hypothetical protein [Flavobacterium pectinovorum]|uniref:Uncharacterized protein n=1 Tax=Flavobacterium pectinovorum TaxID=29533 RepID=A0A502EUF9_9FLAO|nr:hypothetical protein [Flavobacterium pectinovorum]TPG41528.1 hypothetical protein EAH81_08545 [Flavobacterium pectinovorum]